MPKLMEVFDVKEEKIETKPVKDYDIFEDKELLDNLRNTIISNLIDDKIPNNKSLHEYINTEIDKALLGYDLTNLERSHIFNLIDNAIATLYYLKRPFAIQVYFSFPLSCKITKEYL